MAIQHLLDAPFANDGSNRASVVSAASGYLVIAIDLVIVNRETYKHGCGDTDKATDLRSIFPEVGKGTK